MRHLFVALFAICTIPQTLAASPASLVLERECCKHANRPGAAASVIPECQQFLDLSKERCTNVEQSFEKLLSDTKEERTREGAESWRRLEEEKLAKQRYYDDRRRLRAQNGGGEVAQISDGLRVIMLTSLTLGKAPLPASFVISRQPMIYDYISQQEGQKVFKGEGELLSFFQNLPSKTQAKGLWITRSGNPAAQMDRTPDDQKRLTSLIQVASRTQMLMYVCNGDYPRDEKSMLVAWECRKETPTPDAEPIWCEPVPKQTFGKDHPLWECF